MSLDQIIRFFLIGPFPNGLLGGLAINVILAVLTMTSGFFIGLLLALSRTQLGRSVPGKITKGACAAFVEVIRAMPLVLILFWIYFLVPVFAGKQLPIFFSAFLAITLYSAANQAEIFRSGIVNVDKGQWQVAASTGLSKFQTIRYVIVPQVVHKMMPSFVSFFISMFKDTSIATTIGLIDLTRAGLMLSQKYPSQLFFSYFLMALMFFVICFALSRYAKRLEVKQQQKYGR